MKPLRDVSPGARMALGISFFVLFFAAWAFATLGGYVSKTFLADPLTMLKSGWTLLAEQGFATDIGYTVWRVVGGFALADSAKNWVKNLLMAIFFLQWIARVDDGNVGQIKVILVDEIPSRNL